VDHDHDIGTALEKCLIAGLLIAPIAQILHVLNYVHTETSADFDGGVPTSVVNEQNIVHH
jgi:hypothetical protein